MKGLLLIFAIGLAVVVGEKSRKDILPDPSWATLVETTKGSRLLKAENEDSNCTAVYSCQDCTTARVCRPTLDGGYQLLQTIKCGADRPYCDPASGSCVAEEPDSCGQKDNFVCMGNGKYPDSECNRFHACLDLQSMTFQCSVPGENYNARTQICEAGAPCGIFDCAGNEGTKIPHSTYSNYYAYCNKANGPLVVDSCPSNYELNVTSQLCEPACNADGLVADVVDCHYYFKCTDIVIKRGLSYWKRDRLQCPEKQAYSTKEYLCVPEDQVESCAKKN